MESFGLKLAQQQNSVGRVAHSQCYLRASSGLLWRTWQACGTLGLRWTQWHLVQTEHPWWTQGSKSVCASWWFCEVRITIKVWYALRCPNEKWLKWWNNYKILDCGVYLIAVQTKLRINGDFLRTGGCNFWQELKQNTSMEKKLLLIIQGLVVCS